MALSDFRVLDLTTELAGPYCTRLLAGFGADVVKIEPPGAGDPSRQMGPFQGDDPHPEKSATFFYLNLNKRSVTLNLWSPTGKRIFKELVKKADLVVESFQPHVLRELGLSYDVLREVNPKLVMASITPFGQTGPYAEYKATEMILYGMGGSMYSKGYPDREPVSLGLPTAVYNAALVAASGIMGALFGARYQGVGQHVDASLMEGLLGSVDGRIGQLLGYQYSGEKDGREELRGGYANGLFPCKDGYFIVAASGNRMFPRLVKMIGEPEELKDPRFLTPEGQRDPELRDLFESVLISWSMEHTMTEVTALGAENGLICGAINAMKDVDIDAHFNARGAFVDVDHPVMGRVRTIGRPFMMMESPWQERRSAPLLGQHNAEVYGELGYTQERLIRLREAGVI